jgi:hypothetical protein
MGNLLRRQVLVSEELWQKIQIVARSSRRSASAIVRQALQEYLDQQSTVPPTIPSFNLGASDKLERENYYGGRC